MNDKSMPRAEVTLITNANGQPLSKSYALVNGVIVKTPAANMFAGTAERRVLQPGREMLDLLLIIETMPAHQAITLGRVFGGTGDHGETFQITTVDRLAAAPPGSIARSRSHFTFPKGAGIALVDVDLKGAPPEVLAALEHASIRDLLISLYAPMVDVGSISRGSVSSAIHVDGDRTRRAGAGGEHLLMMLGDVSRSRAVLEALHRLFWHAGLGWITVDKAGRLHARSLVDTSVGSPERLVFEGEHASLGHGLVLDPVARKPTLHEGAELDVERFLKHADEVAPQASHDARVKAANQALREEAAGVRAAYEADLEETLVSRGATRQAARKTVHLRGEGCLTSDDIMFDERGQPIGVVEVLLALGAWDWRAVPDPVEGPEYGMTTAQVIAKSRDDGLPGVSTFAHGGGWYRLRWSASGIRQLMERRGATLTADELIEAFKASTDVRAEDVGHILQGAGVLIDSKHPSYFKGGMRLLAASCKRALPAAFPDEPDDDQDGVDGEQIVVQLDGPDEAADARRISEALSKMPEPVIFARGGQPVRVVAERVRHHDGDGFAMRLVVRTGGKDGERRAMLDFVKFLLPHGGGHRPGSADQATLATWAAQPELLPPLMGITSFPRISPTGVVSFTPGYDRRSGFYYDGSLGDDLGSLVPHNPGPREAKEAWRWLRMEVFGDFPFSQRDEGEAVVLAFLLTACTRAEYATAPGFAVSARQPRTGKGKLISVVSLIATGVEAPSTKLTEAGSRLNDEEVGKTVTGLLMMAQPIFHFDNLRVPLGGASIDILLTAPEWQKRVVGLQDTPSLPARVTVCASGNNLAVINDTVPRVLLIDMDARHEAPEKRNGWRHPNLEAWVRQNRPEIVAKVLTILVAYRAQGKPNAGAVTLGNFETWAREIGDLVHWVTDVDPTATQNHLRRDDPERAADVEFLRGWHNTVGNRAIKISEVMDDAPRFYPEPDPDDAIGIPEGLPASERSGLRRVIEERFGARGTVQAYGSKLTKLRGARVGGFMLESLTPDRLGVKKWRVVETRAEHAGNR